MEQNARADQRQNHYYDPAGRLIVVVDPDNGSSATYNYDTSGNILSVTQAALSAVVAARAVPSLAAAGASVTIYGTSFGITANTIVSFNSHAATIFAPAPTAITVPSGATAGPITITAPGGSASTLHSFAVADAAPKVTSVWSYRCCSSVWRAVAQYTVRWPCLSATTASLAADAQRYGRSCAERTSTFEIEGAIIALSLPLGKGKVVSSRLLAFLFRKKPQYKLPRSSAFAIFNTVLFTKVCAC